MGVTCSMMGRRGMHMGYWWLIHYATNRKVVGSIPDEVIFKFTQSFRPH
jgi:hypothetical protein